MRPLILALMIVLLPLRGWAGDVMAVEMASMAVAKNTAANAAHATTANSHSEPEIMAMGTAQTMPDCHEQMASHPATDKPAQNDHCGTCQACQACHTVALSPSPIDVAVNFTSPQLHPTHAAAFTSAATALGQKPPIS